MEGTFYLPERKDVFDTKLGKEDRSGKALGDFRKTGPEERPTYLYFPLSEAFHAKKNHGRNQTSFYIDSGNIP